MTLAQAKRLKVGESFSRPSSNPHDNGHRVYTVVAVHPDMEIVDQHGYHRFAVLNAHDKPFFKDAVKVVAAWRRWGLPMTHTVSTRQVAANEGGSGCLAHVLISCTCGYSEGTTLTSGGLIAGMIYDHSVWHQGDAAREAAKTRKRSAQKAAATRARNADPFGFKKAGIA